GLALLAAHLIIFWLSQDSNVTPPVCLTAFAAATIAKTPPMRTGLTAWKIAKGLYLVPLLIVYTGLVSWDVTTVLMTGFFAIFGTYALIGAIEGYLESKINVLIRLVLLAVGALMVWHDVPLWGRVLSLAIFIGIFIYSSRAYQTQPPVATA
ncbi:TRAP transporter permease, partial [Vibrio cidicii]|nr:TRAP transporter permease [Vibrio cidicii]